MKLHRVGVKADWENTPATERNWWQRRAAASHGYLTPGNIFSITGVIIVALGLIAVVNADYWLGLAGILVGRLLDLADGWAADKTGTKGPIGELLDASVDKLVSLATFIVIYGENLAPRALLLLMLLSQLLISLLAIRQYVKSSRLHPSRIGKLSMAGLWLSLFLYLLVAALGHEAGILRLFADSLAILTAAGGFYASIQYLRGTVK